MSKCKNLKFYDIPVFAPVSKDYYVEIEGKKIDVHPVTVSSKATNELFRGTQRDKEETEQASYINFDFEGSVKLRVVCAWEIFYARVLPLSKGIVPIRGEKNKGDEVSFEISEPGQYVLEINGLHKPLHIFANPMETEKPDPSAQNVLAYMPDEKLDFPGNYRGKPFTLPEGKDTLYFGAGIHHPHVISLKSNQTLYIDGGAIVYASILVEDQCGYRVQRMTETVKVIRRQACNQVHVDGMEAGIFRPAVGVSHIVGGVRAFAGGQHAVHHGLRIDAHPICAVGADGRQFFGIQCVRPTAFHSEFDASG